MDTISISKTRYKELIHDAVKLERVVEYLEETDCVNESDLRMIIGMDKKGDK